MEKSESREWLSKLPDVPTTLASIPLWSAVTTPVTIVNKVEHIEGQLRFKDEISTGKHSRTITLVEAKKHPSPSQGGIIALGIVCGLLILGILLFMLLYCNHRRRKLETQNTESAIPRPRNPRRARFPAGQAPREEHAENGPQNGGFYRPMLQGLPGLPSEPSMGQNQQRPQSLLGARYNAMGTPLNRMRGVDYPPGYPFSNQQPNQMARMRGVGYPPQTYMPGPEYGYAPQGMPPVDPQAYGYGNFPPPRGLGQIHRSAREGSSTGEPPKGEMGHGLEPVRRVPSLGSGRSSNAGNMRGPLPVI
ncbi:hypothetical protein BJ875DRAFT_481505 [Amylocarpus encephaloides]|uniref:Uncharacterized protein n=1 Tax=Amylocarpus encephaloides TaxID=45428 RepID=A0A9P7YPT9_9HELO|nr:hypothetical protein BJ875DRAFT_481505 [Amylocarpus encephaloides]